MLPSYAEGLTWGATGDEVHASEFTPVDRANVFSDNGPMLDVLHLSITIMEHGLHSVEVPLDHELMTETGARQA
jgi:hypothetical protein